jgi:hypothetical protein
MSKIIFRSENETGDDIYAPTLIISVELDGDSSLDQMIQAFKMFLKACEFGEDKVENIGIIE